MNVRGWATWAVRHPDWFLFLATSAARSSLRKTPNRAFVDPPPQSLDCALATLLRQPIDEVDEILAEYDRDPIARNRGPLPERWAATHTLAAACYATCRLLRPATVIEAGSGAGFSAAAILKALYQNSHGQLISLELPRLGTMDASYVGSAVPAALRSRWTVHLGPSLLLLDTIIPRGTTIDVFLHDSDHSYWNQRAEYEFALSRFGPEGFLISDDVRNPSFAEVSQSHGFVPALVQQPPKSFPIGLMSCGHRIGESSKV